MFSLKKVAAAVTGLAIFAGATAASAGVIDFTSASTGTTGSILGGSVTWKMTANGILNNSQAYDGTYKPAGAPLSFETDGYGVGLKDDEITTSTKKQEVITLTFSKATLINALYFLDLFQSKNGATVEMGQVSFDGASPMSLIASDIVNSGAPGYVSAMFKPIRATVLTFFVADTNDAYGFADGALAGVGIAPVPVPAAGLMLMGGLGGLAALRRRKKA